MSEVHKNDDVTLERDVSVSITMQGMNVQFKGPSQSVIKRTLDFFAKQFPEVDLARKIYLNYDKDYLIEKYSRLIKINSEGVRVLVQPETSSTDKMEEMPPDESDLKVDKVMGDTSKTKAEVRWSIKEFIALHLVASRIAKGSGIIQDEGIRISDIESATKANPRSLTSRLSEMMKSGYVTKDLKFSPESAAEGKEEPSTIYRITTVGIHWLNNIIDKKGKIVNQQQNHILYQASK